MELLTAPVVHRGGDAVRSVPRHSLAPAKRPTATLRRPTILTSGRHVTLARTGMPSRDQVNFDPMDDLAPRFGATVRLAAAGLAKVLGDLETRVMHAVWAIGRPAPARTVHEHVTREHDVALLTVITVLNKLVEKGLLVRLKQDDLLHYSSRWTEDEFMSHALRHMVEGVLSFGPQSVAASFVDVLAERDPDQLRELEELIRRRLGKPEAP